MRKISIARTMFGQDRVTNVYMSAKDTRWVQRTMPPAKCLRVIREPEGYLLVNHDSGPMLRPVDASHPDRPWRISQAAADSRVEVAAFGEYCFSSTVMVEKPIVRMDEAAGLVIGIFLPFDVANAQPYRQIAKRVYARPAVPIRDEPTGQTHFVPPPDTTIPLPPTLENHIDVAALLDHVRAINRIKAHTAIEIDLRVSDGYLEAWVLTKIGGRPE